MVSPLASSRLTRISSWRLPVTLPTATSRLLTRARTPAVER